MTARDIAIGTALVASGIGVIGFIISPMFFPLHSSGGAVHVVADRWPEPQAQAPKGDHLKVTLAEPSLLDPAPLGPRDGDPIEQATERKLFDKQVETATKEYHREARRTSETCARHGMHRVYFHRHHRLVWRCRH